MAHNVLRDKKSVSRNNWKKKILNAIAGKQSNPDLSNESQYDKQVLPSKNLPHRMHHEIRPQRSKEARISEVQSQISSLNLADEQSTETDFNENLSFMRRTIPKLKYQIRTPEPTPHIESLIAREEKLKSISKTPSVDFNPITTCMGDVTEISHRSYRSERSRVLQKDPMVRSRAKSVERVEQTLSSIHPKEGSYVRDAKKICDILKKSSNSKSFRLKLENSFEAARFTEKSRGLYGMSPTRLDVALHHLGMSLRDANKQIARHVIKQLKIDYCHRITVEDFMQAIKNFNPPN